MHVAAKALIVTSLGLGCAVAPAPPAIPPPAASEPLSLPEPDEFDEFDDAEPAATPPRATTCQTPAKAGSATPDFTGVRQYIERWIRTAGVPSVAVAVARDGEIVWEDGFGVADRRRRRKADANTMYSLASVSKPFTATGIMVLREQGKLGLDQPISELLPPPGLRSGAGDAAQATVQRVASHTAGLPLHWQFYYEGGPKPPPGEKTLEYYAVTVTPPGERYQYSNLGFGLLEQVIAHVSGRPYAEFMRAELFEPLGLTHTFVGPPPKRAGVTAPRTSTSGEPFSDYGFDHDGASALYSSAHDLARFGMFHLGQLAGAPAVVAAEDLASMREPVAPAATYGLGLGVSREGAVTRVGHNGGMPGVRTTLRMFPEQGVVVVVLVNASIGGEHMQVARMIEEAMGLPWHSDEICALPPGHALHRRFAGTVETIAGPRPLVLEISPTGTVTATLGEGAPRSVREVSFADDTLTGWFWGDAAAELGGGQPTTLRLSLHLRGNTLDGGVSANVPWTSTTTLFARLEAK